MISIALIGADGSGKTTLAAKLKSSFPRPMKYLYMGINIESSNIALPTSRFFEAARQIKNGKSNGMAVPQSLHDKKPALQPGVLKSIWLFIRTLNRIAEEWYRQMVSWFYRRKGFIVLYDRHFLFDFDANELNPDSCKLPSAERIHRWFLHRFYPEPDIVVFLDAPGEVLFARKGEASVEYLNARRTAFLKKGERVRNFVRVDATLPPDSVYACVCDTIEQHYQERLNNRKHV